jgi:TIR domain
VRGVFISHSSKDRALTEQVCAAIGPYLHPAVQEDVPPGAFRSMVDYELVVDFDKLQDGSPWPDQLHEWLARCHAGLILLTPDAVRSPWVLKETTILSWRHSRDPENFRLFVVKHPDVDDAMLKAAKFAPLDLRKEQWIRTLDAAQIATRVVDRLGAEPPPRTPYDELVGKLTDLLDDVKEGTRRNVADEVCVDPHAWRSDRDTTAQYCEAIARRLLNGSLGRLDGVGGLMKALVDTTPVETLEGIFQLVAPYWVDTAAAGVLPLVAAAEPRGVAAMNGARVPIYTARMYATRAHMSALTYIYIPVPGAHAGDAVADTTREIVARISRLRNRTMSEAEVIDDLSFSELPIYVVLPQVPVADDLNALRSRFRTVTFVVSTGERLDHDLDVAGARFVEPEIDITFENAQEKSWRTGRTVIDLKRQAGQ